MQEHRRAEPLIGPARKLQSISEAGVRPTLLTELALKNLFLSGPFSVLDLARLTRLSFELADELFSRLRELQLCHVTGMTGNIPLIAITSQGRTQALDLLSRCQYSGAAPVSLKSYVEQVRKQSVRDLEIHPPDINRAFAHLVLDPKTLWQLGTSLNSGASVFLYGPPGVGKTTIAETCARVLGEDEVWIPYAVEVDGEIITVYDPATHAQSKKPELASRDERWVRCGRPAVLVGGELTIEMLDLQLNAISRYYAGPPQMKANNGVLIIDDFGRQRVRPEELFNRWVVPLDRKIDFLTLAGGRKIEIPFEMLVVFATNMNPAELVDAAFLRRIQTKIGIGPANDKQFCEIFRRVARERGLDFDEPLLKDLIQFIRVDLGQDLRPCHPRDLINQVCWAARYMGIEPVLDRHSLMRAMDAYFMPNSERDAN
jgi:predicted ATPase with chaperone activity